MSRYGILNETHYILNGTYNDLLDDYNDLDERYNNLRILLDQIIENIGFSGHFYRIVDHFIRDWLVYYSLGVEVNISYNRYFYYRLGSEHPSHSFLSKWVVAEIVESYCTIYDDDIMFIANEIKDNCISKDDEDVINAVLSFCQDKGDPYKNIKYGTDGIDDFSKYPIETLAEGNGDCEDKSILFGSLVEALGYDAAIFVITGHVYVGVHLDFTPIHNI